MNIIVSYVKDGIVYLATDTRNIIDDHKKNELESGMVRLRILDNGIIYGVTANNSVSQMLLVNDDIFTLDSHGTLTKKHIVNNIIPKYYKLLRDNGLFNNDKDNLPQCDMHIALGYRDKLFIIYPTLEVFHCQKYDYEGICADYAVAKLDSLDETKDIKQELVEAIQDCEIRSACIGGPYLVVNTKDMKIEVVEAR